MPCIYAVEAPDLLVYKKENIFESNQIFTSKTLLKAFKFISFPCHLTVLEHIIFFVSW